MSGTLDEQLRARIHETVTANRVVLFMKGTKHAPQCGFSASVVDLLDTLGVEYATVDVISDPAIRDGIKTFSEWPTIPQLYIGGEFVGGADIVKEMHQTGELVKLLGVDGGPVAPPEMRVLPAAIEAFRGAGGDAEADECLRLAIDAAFRTELFFGPRRDDDVVVTADGITFHMKPATARRANGLVIDFVQAAAGAGFKLDNPNEPPRVKPLRPEELKAMMETGKPHRLVDVRTEEERSLATIEGSRLLDAAFEQELALLPRDETLVFVCHHGVRSHAAAQRFLEQGFTKVWNLAGGIDAWSSLDPSVPRY